MTTSTPILSDDFLSQAVHTSFGDFEYDDEQELIAVRRGAYCQMPPVNQNEKPLKRFMRSPEHQDFA